MIALLKVTMSGL